MIYLVPTTIRSPEPPPIPEPNLAPAPTLDDVPVPATYKKETSIRKYREENLPKLLARHEAAAESLVADYELRVHAAWEATALDPVRGGQILCVAIARDEVGPHIIWENTEEETLRKLEKWLFKSGDGFDNGRESLCAWHGIDYAYPFLSWRGMKYGLHSLSARVHRSRSFPSNKLLDPSRTSGINRRGFDLLEAAAFFGFEPEGAADLDGSQVGAAFQRGDFDAIRLRTADRLEALRTLVQGMGPSVYL